jgi:hypothetical protein
MDLSWCLNAFQVFFPSLTLQKTRGLFGKAFGSHQLLSRAKAAADVFSKNMAGCF